MLAGLLGVTLSLGRVVLGLAAMLVGRAPRFLGAGGARVGLIAMRNRLSRESLLLDLAFGVAPASHRRQEGDEDDCRDDDDDYEGG